MCEITDKEKKIVRTYLVANFGQEEISSSVSTEEKEIIKLCLEYVDTRFSRMKYILGTAMDFTILIEYLSNIDDELNQFTPEITLEEVFGKYKLLTKRGNRKANTLTLSYQGNEFGIRKIEEGVLELFHSLDRTDYPSAYVYNTGQWQKYQDLLNECFKLSQSGRMTLVKSLINYGLKKLSKNTFYSREQSRVRLFEEIIENFPRGVKGENGGLIYQAIAFGFYYSDFPHLSLVADKVRTGSSRQKRFGDIDCYFGLDLEISIEVKDFKISKKSISKELSTLITNTLDNENLGVAFIAQIDEDAEDELQSKGIKVISQDVLLDLVSLWDWQKQNNAVQGMLHYIAHVEQDPKAVRRLLEFIKEVDPNHDTLTFLN